MREWPAAYSHDTSSVRKLKKPVYTFPLLWFHPMTPQLLVSWQPAVAPMQCTSLINSRPLKFLWISLRCPNDLIFAGTRSPLVYQRPMSAAPCSLISALSRWTFLLKFKIELTPVPSRWTSRASPASTVLTTVTATMSRTQTGAWQTEGNVMRNQQVIYT